MQLKPGNDNSNDDEDKNVDGNVDNGSSKTKTFRLGPKKTSTVACEADMEAAEFMIDHNDKINNNADHDARPDSPRRRLGQQQQQSRPSFLSSNSSSNRNHGEGVQMTTYSAVAVSAEPENGGGGGGSGGARRAATAGSHGASTALGGMGSGSGSGGRKGGQVTERRASAGSIRGLLALGGGGARIVGGGYEEEETVRLTGEGSMTDSPSSATGEMMGSSGSGSEDQAATGLLLGNKRKPGWSSVQATQQPRRGARKELATLSPPPLNPSSYDSAGCNGAMHGENGRNAHEAGEGYDEHHDHHHNHRNNHHHHPGAVRRRALSSPRHRSSLSATSGEGFLCGRVGAESGGGGVGGVVAAGAGAREQHPHHQLVEWKTKGLWYLGAFLLVAGSLVNFASFGFAPQSLLASLGSVQFISNVVFGKVILREIVTRRIIVGTVTIILGNTLTLCFSPSQVCFFAS